MRATQHFHRGLLLSTPKGKKRNSKRNKTIYTGKLPTSKRRMGNLFGFSFNITTTSMESKLAKSYNYFFLFFLKVFLTHKKKARKENKLEWIVQ